MHSIRFIICLFAGLLCNCLQANCQSNLSSNRVLVKESLTLKDRQINAINNDVKLEQASSQTLSTTSAIRTFIDGLVGLAPSGTTNRTDSVLSRNPITGTMEMVPTFSLRNLVEAVLVQRQMLELNIMSTTDLTADVLDSLHVTVTSSDGITTSQRCAGNQFARIYGYGKPPFSVSFFCVNNTPGRNYMLFSDEIYLTDPVLKVQFFPGRNYFEKWANYGDTIKYVAKNIRQQFGIRFKNESNGQPTYRDTIGRREMSIVNNTRNFWPVIYGLGTGVITVTPGEITTYSEYLLPSIDINFLNLLVWQYGGYYSDNTVTAKMHYKLYKNDVLFMEDDIENPGNTYVSYPLDASWKKVKLILDNVD